MRSFFVDKHQCPYCGYEIDATSHSRGEDHAPEAGDVSLCFRCAGVMIFKDRFTLRKATIKEAESVLLDDGVRQVKEAILWANEMCPLRGTGE